jgi:FkbM family methyltransferase
MIYIDCGFYDGTTLKRYIDSGLVDESWTVYAFEPNPDLDIKTYLQSIPLKFKVLKKAVWIKDGRIKFSVSKRENSSSVVGTVVHAPDHEVTVGCIDFSKFVGNLPEDYIICSMDIEGAEFPVLEKMLLDGTIDKINLLDIEFHHRFLTKDTIDKSRELIDEIKKRDVFIRLKVPLE